jgi:hypothetical protein
MPDGPDGRVKKTGPGVSPGRTEYKETTSDQKDQRRPRRSFQREFR